MAPTLTHPRCETFARLVVRLSREVQDLAREIALQQGVLLERQGESLQIQARMRAAEEEIGAAERRLETAATDLVELERVVAEWCRPGASADREATAAAMKIGSEVHRESDEPSA